MVHRSIRNDSMMADGLYIKRVLLALGDFLFFYLYSFSCIAKQVTTLKQHWLLSCLDFLETNIESLARFRYHSIVINITYARPRPLQRRSYKAFCNNLIQLSATALRNICRWEYAVTVDVIQMKLPIQDTVI
jgi:hypothetical protein